LARPDNLAERVEALEAREVAVDSPPAEERWREALQSLENRLGVVEQSGGGPAAEDGDRLEALAARLAELEARTSQTGDVVVDADLRDRIESLSLQLEELRQGSERAGASGAGDARISEVIGRLNWLEQSSD